MKKAKQAVPKQHWEVKYNTIQTSNETMDLFNPKVANQRPCTHNKVNKEDH